MPTSVNRSGMDPDRFQMKDLKRRVRALEKGLEAEKRHSDRLGTRIATLTHRISEIDLDLTKEIKAVLRAALDDKGNGSSLWDL